MNSEKNVKRLGAIIIMVMAVSLSACSIFDSVGSDDTIDYKSTVKQQSLDVPPDLTQPSTSRAMEVPDLAGDGVNTYSAYQGQQANITTGSGGETLPAQDGIRFEHEGPNSWLVLKGTREQLWPRLREFWLKTGFILVVDKPEQGLMETEWAENRANIPKGTIRNLLGKVFASAYTSGLRDKFRVRVEEVPATDSVELFVSHRGMVERVLGSELSSEGSVWEVRPSDPGLEAEMLKRLMVHLGIHKQQADSVLASTAEKKDKARLQTDDKEHVSLILDRDFSRAWRLVGLALDRVSFTVVDRDRSQGIYYVKYSDPDRTEKKGGVLSSLKFWSDDKQGVEALYQVKLAEQGEVVSVVVNNEKGDIETSSTAERILKLLLEQLK